MKRVLLLAALLVGCKQQEKAMQLSEGERLFSQMNCLGCHAHGGGGMGPPLTDPTWIYGSSGDAIHQSIMDGRPNGMPSFRTRLTEVQAWQLVGYVRALGGLESSVASPGRDDHMVFGPPPAVRK